MFKMRSIAAAWAVGALAVLVLGTGPLLAACTPTTTPNTSGVTSNSQLEVLQEICDWAGTASATFTGAAAAGYVAGDLIADSGTAGSVTPMTFAIARAADRPVVLARVRVSTTDTAAAAAVVRVHLYSSLPTVTNGDSGVWLSTNSTYLGCFDVSLDRTFSDAIKGIGSLCAGPLMTALPASGTVNLYGLLEARSSFSPGSTKTWTVTIEAPVLK